MKIVQIIPSISLVYGGPSQMMLGFAPALARQGIHVTILTTNSNGDQGQPPLDVPLNKAVWQDGYEIRYFACSPFHRYKFSLNLLTWFYHHAHSFDVAHLHALFSPVITASAMICRQQKLPYILRPLGTLDAADFKKKKLLKIPYFALLEKPNLTAAAALHFTSQQEANASTPFHISTPQLIIPLGVSPPLPITKNNNFPTFPKAPRILFLSRIEAKKGLDLLIPALEKLQAENIDFHFILAGNNPQDSKFEAKIHQQLQGSTVFKNSTITGFVSGDLKTYLLQSADIFVLPSYYENFGIAVVEAMAAGVPVVISNQVYIWPEIAQNQAGWVADCNVSSLTEMLRCALQNPDQRKQRGNNAQQYALKHYNWDNIAQQMIQIYQQIIDNS